MLAESVVELHPHAVQVDRMLHHGVVDQDQSNPLIGLEPDRLGRLGELLPVEGPHVPFHVPGQVQFDVPLGLPLVIPGRHTPEVGVPQHLTAIPAQPHAGVIQPRTRYLRHHRVSWTMVPGRMTHPWGSHVVALMTFHVGHVHPAHVHTHVGHRPDGPLPPGGKLADHVGSRGQRPAGIPTPVHRLSKDRVPLIRFRFHDHIIGLGVADPELIDHDRLHRLPVRRDHRHPQPGDPDIEEGGAGAVDEP